MGSIAPRTNHTTLDSLAAMRRSMKSSGRVDGQGAEKLAFGKVLRSYRLRKDLTQEQLGWQAQIDRKFISALERGKKEPGLMTLIRISRTLGVPMGEFMNEVERELGNPTQYTELHEEQPQPPSHDHIELSRSDSERPLQ